MNPPRTHSVASRQFRDEAHQRINFNSQARLPTPTAFWFDQRPQIELTVIFVELLRTERVFADLRSSWEFLALLWTSFRNRIGFPPTHERDFPQQKPLRKKDESHTQHYGVFQFCSSQNIQYQIRITFPLCGLRLIKAMHRSWKIAS